jgi:hypothetical protein
MLGIELAVRLIARTNNAHEMSSNGKIGNVWQAFLKPNLVAKIPNKIGVDLSPHKPATRRLRREVNDVVSRA